MNSEREDNCTANFVWNASKLIQNISYGKTSRENDLNSLRTAFRSRRFNFLDFNEQRLHLCPKCYSLWKEARFSMRIRRNQVPKSHRKRTNLQIVRCHVCQNKCKSVVSKPESNIVHSNSTFQSEPVGKVLIKKKKRKRKKDKLVGLNILSTPLNSSNKQFSNRNLKQNNFEQLTGKSIFTDFDENVARNLEADQNLVMNDSKIGDYFNDIQTSSRTSNNLLKNILLCRHSIKNTNNSLTNSINFKNNKKKEKLKKNKHKVNELKQFINSL